MIFRLDRVRIAIALLSGLFAAVLISGVNAQSNDNSDRSERRASNQRPNRDQQGGRRGAARAQNRPQADGQTGGARTQQRPAQRTGATGRRTEAGQLPGGRRPGGQGATGRRPGGRGPGGAGGQGRGPGGRGPGGRFNRGPGQAAPQARENNNDGSPALSKAMADQVPWRSIGPANMSGRITAIAVYGKDPNIWWAATAAGGLLKTTNNGITFEHQFDDQATVSIGDVQVAQSNPDIIWVGTGESNPRNSVSWGDGVYKSTDGGKTFTNMGLKKTFQTGALAIHPENPEIVWVGSLGRLWGPNPERGLFKTTDGGKTWKKVLFVDDKTGVIDVQLNPKNPDEMLVATYERKRDGFDGNDPVQRFGEGSGIYKSTDGGDSFERITEGLPSCKMGRIGMDYYESDPNIVVAVVESEKIAKLPENYSFSGITGEDADVGARLTRITNDGPAAKAGLKVDDIVVSVDERIVPSYTELTKEIHKHLAGDTVKLVISRDKKLIDIELKLAKTPERTGRRNQRTPFTGTLGGQSANLQDTQGPDGHEYGGVYLSEDGGSSWKRINSLNPRPMYYSNIQIDPLDRNNMYVCGTSLYKSSDGGKTFTGDGGSDGIHVDHHALWLDSRDGRHMILGNDGGIHVTFDRMEHWDHLNHVAIGQFYHVGVDANLDYNVYGGLQDNGSWGGPSRTSGGGPINSDWFRVGGGDGFITRADPNDANQIYFESQNGSMGRIHLETGARGSIRPRERGIRFRFNWKTPYILSPHNSTMHYSAGNYVLRSYNKGDNVKRISPEITNSDRGAGSAISESPAEAGVIYVGTTDGAVWMTKNGGNDWQPLFYTPTQPEESDDEKTEEDADKKADEKPASDSEKSVKKSDKKSEAGEKKETKKKDAKKKESKKDTKKKDTKKEKTSSDPVTGQWEGQMIGDQIPEDRAGLSFTLKLDKGEVTGEFEGRRGPQDIVDGKFDAKSGEISWAVEGGRGNREFTATIKKGKMTGEMSAGGGRFQIDFEASKIKKDGNVSLALPVASTWLTASIGHPLTSSLFVAQPQDDPISGDWDGVIEHAELPDGRIEFSIEFSMNKANKLSGEVTSHQGNSEITTGDYNSKTNAIEFTAENDDITLDFSGTVDGDSMSGKLEINGGDMVVDFGATRAKSKEGDAKTSDESKQEPKEEKAKPKKKAEPKAKAKESAKAKAPAKTGKKANDKQAEATDAPKQSAEVKDDLISGTWTGTTNSQRGGESDVTLLLKRAKDGSITGTYESPRGEQEITSGSYNKETKELSLMLETDQFTMEFSGKVEGKAYSGDLEFNGGAFTMEFSVTKTGGPETAKSKPADEKAAEPEILEGPTGEKSLASLMPGPRWVSSIEASKFSAERCYITFDGHRSNDDGVYVFVTNDYGQTWEALNNNLPENAGSVRVLREDVVNQDLLYLGCEFASFFSIDRGASWTRIGGLPTVSVHEFAVHPTAGEIVAATHGRSLWIADVSVLRQLSKAGLAEDAKLYQSKDVIRYRAERARGSSGTRRFVGTNPKSGAVIAYSLGKNARQVDLKVLNLDGDVVKSFETENRRGLHVLDWDLRMEGQGRFQPSVPSGVYLIRLKVDGKIHQNKITIKADPSLSPAARTELETSLDESLETEILELLGQRDD